MAYSPVNEKRLAWVMPLLVLALTVIAFLPALKNGFVWDDIATLVENKKYRGLGCEQLKWMFTSCSLGPYSPLESVTRALDYLVWGMNPFGYHLTSVLLHGLNALVFYFLCVKLLSLAVRPLTEETGLELSIPAGFAALFFSLHPLRVESVAWLSGRHDVLSCFFYLLAIFLYITPRSAGGEKSPFWRRHILPQAAFFLALLSKGMAISLPGVLVVLDIYPLGRLSADPRRWFSGECRKVWLEKIPFFVLAAVFGVIGYACQAKVGALASCQEFGFGSRASQVLFAVFFYVRKTLIPFDLSPLYRLSAGFGLLTRQGLFAGAAISAITAAVVALRRRWPAGLAVWGCYLVTLAPVAGIVKINSQAAADRYTYLPCLGFALLAGAGFRACRQAAGKRFRNICAVPAVLLLSGLIFLTWRQEGSWRDSETLWRHALSLNPKLELAHNNLASFLAAQGKSDEAAWHYREALRITPAFALAHRNLGLILAGQDKNDEAERHYREALTIKPDLVRTHYNLALILAARGKNDEAAGHYREELRLNPDLAEAACNLGVILAAQGKLDEAAGYYREALRINPDFAFAHYNLGGIMAAQGSLDEAVKHYTEALRISPNFAQAHYTLSLILSTQGRRELAAKHYRQALQLDPNIGNWGHNPN